MVSTYMNPQVADSPSGINPNAQNGRYYGHFQFDEPTFFPAGQQGGFFDALSPSDRAFADPNTTDNRRRVDGVQRLMQIDPQFRQIYEMYGQTLTRLQQYSAPGWDDQEAQRRSRQLMTGAPDEFGSGSGPQRNPGSEYGALFTWETAYASAMADVRKERADALTQSTALRQDVSAAIRDARDAGRIAADVVDLLPILGPANRDGVQPVIARMAPNGTVTNLPTRAIEELYGASPDARLSAETSAANRANTTANTQAQIAASDVNSRRAAQTAEGNRQSREAIAAVVNEAATKRMALDFRQSVLSDWVQNRGVDARLADVDATTWKTEYDDARQRMEKAVEQAGVLDGHQIQVWAQQDNWDQKEAQFAAEHAQKIWDRKAAGDQNRFTGEVALRNQDLDFAKALAIKAQDGFAEHLKKFSLYRTDMDGVVQAGLVAIAAGKKVPAGFAAAFALPADTTAKVLIDVGEQAARRYLDRPTGPILPDKPVQVDRPAPAPYTPLTPRPAPDMLQSPEMIGALATPGYGAQSSDRVRGLLDQLRNDPTNMMLQQEAVSAGLITPEQLTRLQTPMPGMAPIAPPPDVTTGMEMPNLLPRDQSEDPFGGPLELPPIPPQPGFETMELRPTDTFETVPIPNAVPGMGIERELLDTGGGDWLGQEQAHYRNPMDTVSAWNDGEQNPIVRRMDQELLPYMEPDYAASTSLAIGLILADDEIAPQQAWEAGFPDRDWLIGEDDYDYTDWEGQEWYG